jgi:ABC-type nitrate/sulfonate/bicarbonate transport system substrate-binding protein
MMTKFGARAFGAILLSLSLLITRADVAAQKLEKMRVGYNAITGSNRALWISKEAGLTAKNGLDVEFVYIESGSRITQAMLAGDLRLGNTGSGSSIQARAKGPIRC